jgi:hypothetical protein
MLANAGTAGQLARPRTGVAIWRTALAIDLATATGLMVAWQGVLWLFALLVAYAGRIGTAPETSDEFFTRILVKAEGVRHLDIARHGYDSLSAAHPPFFAMLTRLLATFGLPLTWAGAFVAHIALVGALVYLIALARLELAEEPASRTIGVALLWPAAPLLGMVGPSSLLLLTATAALYHARRRQWGWAGLWAAHAALSGGVGLLVLIPLLVEWLEDRPWRRTARQFLGGLGAVLAAPLAFVAFLALLQVHIGSPRAYFRAQTEVAPGALLHPLGLETLLDWRAIAANAAPLVRGYPTAEVPFQTVLIPAMIDSGVIALALLCAIWLLREGRRSYGLYVLAGAVATFLIGGLPGSAANLLPFAPIYLVTARWCARPVVGYLGLILGIDLLALFMYLMVNGYWPV